MLRCEKLTVAYGPVNAVVDVSFAVEPGKIIALIGNNGAGKSSILNAISATVPTTCGRIWFGEREITGLKPAQVVKAGIAHVPEGRHVFPGLSVRENLLMGAYLQEPQALPALFEQVYWQFPRLRERAQQPAGTMSGGEQQMVALARALMSRPRLLMLDEPSMGLAPKVVAEVMDSIRQIASSGVTVLLVEQNAYQALTLADYGIVMDRGRLRLEGPAADLLTDPAVQAAYIG